MFNLGPVWGVDIGDSAIKAVKLRRVGEQIVLLDFQIIRYSDLTGEPGTRREEALTQALQALKAAGMGNDRCVVSIAPQSVFSRFISLPPVDRRRIPEIVLYEARQQIPFSLDEVIWNYELVRKEIVVGEEIEIGLFAVKREVVDSYLQDLAPVRNQLHGIQVGPLALYNFVRHEMDLKQPTVILDIGAHSTDLLIIDGDKFWMRNLPIAGNSFTSVLEKRLNIPRGEAEKLKLNIADSRHRRKLLEVLRPTMRDLVAEVQRSIGYYKSLAQEVKFEDIIILGEGYRLFGLDRFLAEQLQYRISPLQRLERVPYQGSPDRMDELGRNVATLGPAIGLALQGLGRARATINFLPDDFVIRRELHSKRYNALIAAAIIWAIVGCLWIRQSSAMKALEGMTGRGEDVLREVEPLQRRLNEAEQRRKEGRARAESFSKMGMFRDYYPRVIGAIASVLPKEEVYLEGGFVFSRPTGATMGGGPEGEMPMERGMEMRPEVGPGGRRMPSGFGPMRGAGGQPPRSEAEAERIGPDDIVLQFRLTAAEREKDFFQRDLPAYLKEATIYPERLPVVTAVEVGEITRTEVVGLAEAGESVKPGLTAQVYVGLIPPERLEEALEKHRQELARKAAERAASGAPSEGATPPHAGVPGERQSGEPRPAG